MTKSQIELALKTLDAAKKADEYVAAGDGLQVTIVVGTAQVHVEGVKRLAFVEDLLSLQTDKTRALVAVDSVTMLASHRSVKRAFGLTS